MNPKKALVGIAVAALSLSLVGCTVGTAADTKPKEEAAAAEPASTFPEKPITLIVQANPGGGSDLSSRALADQLSRILDTDIIVENRPGAGGATAMEYVAGLPADGYTLGFGPVEIAMLNTTQGADVLPENYDLLGQIMLAPGVISVSADSPHQTLEDLIAAAKGQPLTVGNSGTGSIWEAAAKALAGESGAQFTNVPHEGGAPAVAAVIGGQIDAVVSGAGEAKAGNDDGTLRVLAVLHDEEHPNFPGIPTAAEAGYPLEFGGWGGIYAPAGLPTDVHATLEAAIKEAVASDEYQAFQKNAGNLVVYRNSADWTTFVNEQFTRFAELLG
ncbi:tripartite tricarboxylate transporter substrate binding protein [Microterricola viridarii]|uniref:Tripartite-type tricarboxylate transporter, receptor component TctC n=1 Tax=Microterricola viridarii TaxID=412690 RepID=A0A1H1RM60_9MICO|nr:tripartite tricarboxylate transporter substrate binding protein [Microterricola viridarii]SDS36795.1 Tripartite-type tricarboxylate transporter, receptor component TctC [Microterricola viridarii]